MGITAYLNVSCEEEMGQSLRVCISNKHTGDVLVAVLDLPSLLPGGFFSFFFLMEWLCCVLCLVTQWYSTLCDPKNYSLPGSSVHRILQARVLGWVAMPSSRGSSQPRSPTLQVDSLTSEPPGKPFL